MAIAICNALGQVVTFVRDDLPEGWTPPEGCAAIPEAELPAGWVREPERHDMGDVRKERNERLTASDWTQVADAPVDQAAWAAYRQALRDLPSVYTGAGPIPWPVAP
jgi:hypothetical protein